MNSETMAQVSEDISNQLSQMGALKEHVEHAFMETVTNNENIFELTEDEERLLKAYRNFITRNKPNAIFSWKTPDNRKLVFPEKPTLIHDPCEMVHG